MNKELEALVEKKISDAFNSAFERVWNEGASEGLAALVPDTILMSHEHYKIYFREAFPNRFALYNAGWKSGFTVNNISV